MDNIKNFNSADNSGKGYKITIVVLGIILIGLAILTYIQKTENTKYIARLEHVNHQKETSTFQYQGLLDDYESLETTSDSISSQLDSEKERIKELIADLRTTKSNNRYQINKYKNELIWMYIKLFVRNPKKKYIYILVIKMITLFFQLQIIL